MTDLIDLLEQARALALAAERRAIELKRRIQRTHIAEGVVR